VDRQAELLEVPYFHVVFTVPEPIATIAFQNQTVVYDILFRAASETLRTITIAGVELLRRIRKDQFNLGRLRLRDRRAPAVWEAVLAA